MEDDYMFLDNSLLRLLLLENEKESWVGDINSTRETQGEFTLLFPDLIKNSQKFFDYFRMLPETFNYILHGIRLKIEKQCNFRSCIQPTEKLAITLR